MGEGGIKRIDDFVSFVGFQGTNSGRILGALFQHLLLSLRGTYNGRRIKI